MVNLKSSGFDKGTGEKSGKFQFDCDGCILFTRRGIIHFPFPHTICLFILFFAAELSRILQSLFYYINHSDLVTEFLLSIVFLATPGEYSVYSKTAIKASQV